MPSDGIAPPVAIFPSETSEAAPEGWSPPERGLLYLAEARVSDSCIDGTITDAGNHATAAGTCQSQEEQSPRFARIASQDMSATHGPSGNPMRLKLFLGDTGDTLPARRLALADAKVAESWRVYLGRMM